MFFTDVYNEEAELMLEDSVQLDEYEVMMIAEEMDGELYEAMEIVNESNEEFFNLQAKMMHLEHHAVVSENAELLSEGKQGFFQSAKQWFINLWKKITAWFQSVFESIKGMADKDAKLVKKYKKELAGKSTKDLELYNWKNGKLTTLLENVSKISPEDASKFDGKTAAKKYRSSILGFSVKEDGNFIKLAKEKVRGKEKSAKNVMTGEEAISYLETAKTDIATIKLAKKTSDKLYKQAINKVEIEGRSEYKQGKIDGMSDKKLDKTKKDSGKTIANLKTLCNVANQAFACTIDLLKERRSDARLAVKNMAKGLKEEEKEEANKSESVLDLFSI